MCRRLSVRAFLFAALAVVVSAGCGGGDVDEPAVATPSLTLSDTRVPIGSPLTLTYKFQVAPDARIDGDYIVFVHVLDQDGEQLWTDDHQPPTPTSAWKPGETVEYQRTIFVPNYPYIGAARVRLGLYRGDTRLALAAQQAGRHEYEVASFQLLPQSENIFLIYKEGWHPAEVAADSTATEWQWTQKSGTVSFRNPKKDVVLYLEAAARPDVLTPPQEVVIRIGDQRIASFPADFAERRLQTFPVSATQLGSGEMTELSIDVDRTFSAPGDNRELGLRIFHLFVDPRER